MKLISRSKSTQATHLFGTANTKSYQFFDSGSYKRIEQFGSYNVVRSCPSASWPPGSSWARFGAKITYDGTSGKAGTWNGLDLLDPNWQVTFELDQTTTARIVFTLAPSDLGQVGVFPEQQENWRWIFHTLQQQHPPSASTSNLRLRKVLNGFAYTGGSTMAALSADNVQVVHLDAAKSSVQWAMRNAAASGLYSPTNSSNNDSSTSRSVRWITDDCLTFLDREVRRGNTYDGLIFDPPAFGRGGNGKIWKLDKDLPMLVETLIPQLMSDDPLFVLLSCHDVEWPASRLAELLQSAVTKKASNAGVRWLGGRRSRDHKEQSRVGVIQLRHDEKEVQSMALCGGLLEYGPMVLSESNDAFTTTPTTITATTTDRLAGTAKKSQSHPLPLGGFARWRQLP
jgi:23S rRNA (cytosine1962-C5)-methyltransferase